MSHLLRNGDQRLRWGAVAASLALVLARGWLRPAPLRATEVQSWRQESSSAFAKAHKERVVASDSGAVRLARKISPAAPLTASHAWDLLSAGGALYVATGDEGKVFRGDGESPWAVAY